MQTAERSAGNITQLKRFEQPKLPVPREAVGEFPEEVVRSFSESMGLYDRVLSPAYLFSVK